MEREKDLEFCKRYLNCWLNAMLDKNSELLNEWHGNWTDAHMQKVLYPLARLYGHTTYGYDIQKEYYRVDFTVYTHYGNSVCTLDYAIEHENARFELDGNTIKNKGWFDEFAKLLPLKCTGARVIIGYDNFESVDTFKHKIKFCTDLLNNDKIANSIADCPVLLIIFPLTKYIKKRDFSEPLIHLVRFYKNDSNGVWETDIDFENDILDKETKEGLISAYNKIAELK